MSEPKWRVGRTLGRTLYLNGQCVGMVDTKELATDIVDRMNGPQPPPRGLPCKTCLGARVLCFRDMKAEPCQYHDDGRCPNTGHHTCPECF